jgi:carbamoyl-phosphate synthase large subunit
VKTVLVSGASGIVGYGILRSLKSASDKLNTIGTSMYSDSVAQGFCDVFELAPPTCNAAYMPWLLEVIERHDVDLIIPGIEVDMYEWVEHVQEIERVGARLLLNSPELIRLCKDKWLFYEELVRSKLSCAIASSLNPDYEALKGKFGIPFLLKPRRGYGSKGIVRVDGEEAFRRHRDTIGPIRMAQPIVGTDEEEFTSSAFCDGVGGLCAVMTLRRRLSTEGFTEKAEVVSSKEFTPTISALCELFRPIGPTNFQFRRCGQSIKLLEINPRISSSTSIRAAFGYNESMMAVDFSLESRLPNQPDIRPGRAVRYWEDHIYYDNSIHS